MPAGATRSSSSPAVRVLPLHTWRDYVYGILLLTFVPLLFHAGDARKEVEARLKRTLEAHPEIKQSVEEMEGKPGTSVNDVFALLPGQRIEGAFLAHDSWAHWWMAALAAGGFFGIIISVFPSEEVRRSHLVLVGLFTGTLGVVMLLVAQFMPFIANTYGAAVDPNANFFVSWFGFTFGVGFCEEVCKALPLLWYLWGGGSLKWRGACLWGLASGAGFGVSEGIHYAGFYNGVMDGGVYVERFISCVGLHVMFSGAAAIMIFKYHKLIAESGDWFNMVMQLMAIIAVPMFAHGLYDTLLKKDMNALALLTDLFAFAWLAWQIETMRKNEERIAEPKKPTLVWNGRGWVRAG